MTSSDDPRQLVRDLGQACGFELELVEESIFVTERVSFSATARSPQRSSASRAVFLEALAKIQIAPTEDGGTETWALVFFFVNGQRVAPPEMCHMTLRLDRAGDGTSQWESVGWEADVHEEWTGLERLDEG